MGTFKKLLLIAEGLNKKYPDGNEPFRIITRLCEEAEELAKAVNHFENTGSKVERYGPPNKEELAKEVQDVIRSALHIVMYYGIQDELEKSIDLRLNKLKSGGFIRGEK